MKKLFKNPYLILGGVIAAIYFFNRNKQTTVNGIKTHIDLFEDFENIPTKIKKVLNKYENAFINGDYNELTKALNEIRKNGYTFDFYLDGQAYGLRPINIPLEKLKGYENL